MPAISSSSLEISKLLFRCRDCNTQKAAELKIPIPIDCNTSHAAARYRASAERGEGMVMAAWHVDSPCDLLNRNTMAVLVSRRSTLQISGVAVFVMCALVWGRGQLPFVAIGCLLPLLINWSSRGFLRK